MSPPIQDGAGNPSGVPSNLAVISRNGQDGASLNLAEGNNSQNLSSAEDTAEVNQPKIIAANGCQDRK